MAKQKNDNGKSNNGTNDGNGGKKTRSNDNDSEYKNKQRREIKAARRKGSGKSLQAPKLSSEPIREIAVDEAALAKLRGQLKESLNAGIAKLAGWRNLSMRTTMVLEFAVARLLSTDVTPCDADSIIEAYQSDLTRRGEEEIPEGQLKSLRKALNGLHRIFIDECRRQKVRNSEMPVIKQKWFTTLRSEMHAFDRELKAKIKADQPQTNTEPAAAQAA